MSGQTFTTTVPNGENFELVAAMASKYTLQFMATGTKVEFVMLAGQSFKVTGVSSNITVTMDPIEPTLPGGGLQLVPILQ